MPGETNPSLVGLPLSCLYQRLDHTSIATEAAPPTELRAVPVLCQKDHQTQSKGCFAGLVASCRTAELSLPPTTGEVEAQRI